MMFLGCMPGTDELLAAGFPPATAAQWEELVRAKEKDPNRKLSTILEEGLEAKWVYTPDDSLAPDPGGVPGAEPFVRGTRAGRPWAIRQENTATHPREANAQILEDLEGGATEILLGAPDQDRRAARGDPQRRLSGHGRRRPRRGDPATAELC